MNDWPQPDFRIVADDAVWHVVDARHAGHLMNSYTTEYEAQRLQRLLVYAFKMGVTAGRCEEQQ